MTSARERLESRENRDNRAPDGLVSGGYRWVRPGGRVRFAHAWWQSDKLKEFVGQEVYVHAGDYWYGEVDVADGRGRWLCKIKADEPRGVRSVKPRTKS